jgi:hypothetical protein
MGISVEISPIGDPDLENFSHGDGGESPPERDLGTVFYPRYVETLSPKTLLK